MGLSYKSSIMLLSTIALNFLVMLKTTRVFSQIGSEPTSCQSALLGGPIVDGKRKLSPYISTARDLEGIRHRDALMEIFLELTESEIRALIEIKDINVIVKNNSQAQIKEIITDFHIQKNNDVLNMDDESIDRLYLSYNEVTEKEVEEVFRVLNIISSDSNASKGHRNYHLKKILEEIEEIRKANERKDIFYRQLQVGIIEKVRVSKDVQKTFNVLNDEVVKEKFQDFIEVLNIQDRLIRIDRLRSYMPKEGFALADTNVQHAHINGGNPTYLVCYTIENNIIDLFFFGTHEQMGKKFKICKKSIRT